MKVATKVQWIFLWMALFSPWAGAHGVKATLDRSKVQWGETVTLNLTANGGGRIVMPDLSSLKRDFQVLGSSSNSSISIVNGRRSESFTIGVVLRPKHAGNIQVPSLMINGAHTAPLPLTVILSNPVAAAHHGKSIWMEATVAPDHGYVGQQLVYTMRLYYDREIGHGSVTAPRLTQGRVYPLDNDKYDTVVRDGRTYHVLERHYALVPKQSGRLLIPPLQFQGVARDPSAPSVIPPGFGQFFGPNNPFGGGQSVMAVTAAVTLHVKARPGDWHGTWLPARQLGLTLKGFPGSRSQLRVGQLLNLRMRLQAEGLAASALPKPDLPVQGATVYPDHTQDKTSHRGQWLIGTRTRSFAVLPKHPGTLTFPPISLKWFNVRTGQPEVARLSAHRFTVLPALGTSVASASAPPPPTKHSVVNKTPPQIQAPVEGSVTLWRWVAWISLALLTLVVLGVLVAWPRHVRMTKLALTNNPPRAAGKPESGVLQQAFMRAVADGDVAAQASTLLAWARAERPHLRHLGSVSAALDAPLQRRAIAAIQKHQYGQAPAALTVNVAKAFATGFVWHSDTLNKDDSPLPPLYPFDLG